MQPTERAADAPAPELTDKPRPRAPVVSPSQLLLAIAQHEPLEATLAAFPGTTREQVQKLLRGAAITLARAAPAPAAAASAAPVPAPTTGVAPQAGSRKPEAGSPGVATDRVMVFSDGAAKGNPGPAGAGAVILDGGGRVVERLGKYLGHQTNNVAEYEGLLLGLRRALAMGAKQVDVRADSELMIRQLEGAYKVKNAGLKPLFDEAKRLLAQFQAVTLRHVPRAQNALADEMSNRAIDEKM